MNCFSVVVEAAGVAIPRLKWVRRSGSIGRRAADTARLVRLVSPSTAAGGPRPAGEHCERRQLPAQELSLSAALDFESAAGGLFGPVTSAIRQRHPGHDDRGSREYPDPRRWPAGLRRCVGVQLNRTRLL